MRKLVPMFIVALWAPLAAAMASPLDISPRPLIRPAAEGLGPAAAIPVQARADSAGFTAWRAGFEPRARAAGISQSVIDAAFSEISLEPDVIRLDRNQSEFNRTLWEYLDSAVSDNRINNGRSSAQRQRETLAAIERRYGVEAEIVVAIWGLESAFGAVRGDTHIPSALATLAYEGRRRDFFEQQLIAALRILQSGDTTLARMRGSWAGAMGHTQFMPTSYLDHAVDFTGDGRRDIWGDDPTDALASTANYLREFGWTTGQPWGMEVTLPAGFDYAQSGERTKRNVSHWNGLGVRLTNGQLIPDHGRSSILLPAGAQGVALVIFDNFHVIERYNPADAYVIAVGHLADRITGGPAFQSAWPRGDRALSRGEREELQRRLTRAGFSTDGIDGVIGPNTIDAIRRFQASRGLVADGYASLAILQILR